MPTPPRTRRLAAVLAMLAVVVGACASPATPSPVAASSPLVVVPSPSPVPSLASPSPDATPSDPPVPSDSPSASPSATPPAVSGRAVATRIVIAALRIDLAVVKSPRTGVYPYCNVAMYFGAPMGQPGGSRATYIFAHARDGMFGPIYELTLVRRTPNKMVGMLVNVYTSDSMVHTYRVVKVLPHQLTLSKPIAVRSDQLWLQTSEGPHGTPGKTQVVANPDSVAPADYAASHPKPRIVKCG